jgi:hypothetical protein
MDLNTLAILYDTQKKYNDAEKLYKRALAVWERSLGPGPLVCRRKLGELCHVAANDQPPKRGCKLLERAKAIRAKYSAQGTAK